MTSNAQAIVWQLANTIAGQETNKTPAPSNRKFNDTLIHMTMDTIEIFILNLKPGTRESFQEVYVNQSLPLLRKWKINVVAHGASKHDENTYFVIRSFKSLEDRQKSEDAFYGSDDWKKGPRTAILSFIESSATLVVPIKTIKSWTENIK